MIHAYQLVVLAPYAAALILVAIPGYRVGAVINVLASAATLVAGLWLMVSDGTVGAYRLTVQFARPTTAVSSTASRTATCTSSHHTTPSPSTPTPPTSC